MKYYRLNKKMLYKGDQPLHPGLTRVSSIRFLLFEIKRVLVYIIQQSFNLRICLFYIFSFKMHMPTKKYLRKKLKNVFNGSNCDQKSQRSGILTEPLNPRGYLLMELSLCQNLRFSNLYIFATQCR